MLKQGVPMTRIFVTPNLVRRHPAPVSPHSAPPDQTRGLRWHPQMGKRDMRDSAPKPKTKVAPFFPVSFSTCHIHPLPRTKRKSARTGSAGPPTPTQRRRPPARPRQPEAPAPSPHRPPPNECPGQTVMPRGRADAEYRGHSASKKKVKMFFLPCTKWPTRHHCNRTQGCRMHYGGDCPRSVPTQPPRPSRHTTIPSHDVQMSRYMQILNFSTMAVAYALGKNQAVSSNILTT
jgi:hypothetical protein